jgi:hypothetical protein
VSARIRAGSGFRRFLCFVFIHVRCLRVPQVEDTAIEYRFVDDGSPTWRPVAAPSLASLPPAPLCAGTDF